jgi:hypothetical protein
MTVVPPNTPDPRALLAQTLRDPLAYHPATHVRAWLQLLSDRFPMLSFHPRAYRRLHKSELPTTYPLRVVIESILGDEGINPEGDVLDPVAALLDRRRSGLAAERIEVEIGEPVGGHTRFLPSRVCDLVFDEAESEHGGGGVVSPYEELGRELVTYVEDLQFAPRKTERKAAKNALAKFMRAVGAALSTGKPVDGAPEAILKALLTETRDLGELCWEVLPGLAISDRTNDIMSAYNVPDKEKALWSLRLALPVFSRRELAALLSAIVPWAVPTPTPRVFAIWLLAYRLGIGAPSLARKLLGSKAGASFRGRKNPIDGTVSH